MLKIETAVISVSDKAGVVEFAKFLAGSGVKIISTGGTAKALEAAGVEVVPINKITGNEKDDYFDGRMKTISFQYESALLYRRGAPEHVKQAEELGIPRIDMVVCNLYPFEKVTASPDVTIDAAIENIDIGGPCMVRAAAKNHESIAIVVSPEAYPGIMEEMKANGGLGADTLKKLAAVAFERTADYDSAISGFLAKKFSGSLEKRMKYTSGEQLGRYAENWHQKGWLYRDEECSRPNIPNAKQLHGGAMGYNNYLDAESALRCAMEFAGIGAAAVCIVKHGNPCGLATAPTSLEAMQRAWQGDPVSAFGGVVAMTMNLDLATAKYLEDRFVEIIAAPGVDADALDYIKSLGKKKDGLRILQYNAAASDGIHEKTTLRAITGGMLEQESDELYYLTPGAAGLFSEASELTCPNSGKKLQVGIVTKKKMDVSKAPLLDFALRHLKHVKSNAIVIAREYAPGYCQSIGMGCGQPNRRDSVMLCGMRAVDNLRLEHLCAAGVSVSRDEHLASLNATDAGKFLADEDKYVAGQLQGETVVLASDAFFPFRDGLDNAAETRVRNIAQPGGSVRDDEVIAAADEHGIAMIFTGVRKFNH